KTGYRLPKIQGRSASDSPPPQDVGSGRDLMKKFMMMRGLFQQPSDNVIIITNPSTTTTTTTTDGTPSTTTTTTTTPTTNTTGRSIDGTAEEESAAVPVATMSALAGLEDRLELPEAEPLVIQETDSRKTKLQKRFRVKNLQLVGSAKRSQARKPQVRRRVHRHHKNKRSQKAKNPKSGKTSTVVNQQRNSEASTVNFIEPYHNDRPQRQTTSQSGSDSRLQRIWRRFQIA
ncbi:hypothetical protein KR032_000989, partial [Drosophila birchii]